MTKPPPGTLRASSLRLANKLQLLALVRPEALHALEVEVDRLLEQEAQGDLAGPTTDTSAETAPDRASRAELVRTVRQMIDAEAEADPRK
ncbi:MAG: hypothetical protein ABI818_11705 [Acidobacteriota bacterium]